VVRARRLFVRVRREHAIDAMAAGVRPSSRRANAPLGQCRAAPDAAAGAKPAGVCHQRGGEVVVNLAAGRRPVPERASCARTRRPRGHRLLARSAERRRACCALGRAGTQTSWGRSAGAPGPGPTRATRSRSLWVVRGFCVSDWFVRRGRDDRGVAAVGAIPPDGPGGGP